MRRHAWLGLLALACSGAGILLAVWWYRWQPGVPERLRSALPFLHALPARRFYLDEAAGRVRTRSNNSGGIQGGITNGEDILLRVAFKPVATIFKDQETVDASGASRTFRAEGRHDPCVVPRAVPIVETAVALVLADHWLRHRARHGLFEAGACHGEEADTP